MIYVGQSGYLAKELREGDREESSRSIILRAFRTVDNRGEYRSDGKSLVADIG